MNLVHKITIKTFENNKKEPNYDYLDNFKLILPEYIVSILNSENSDLNIKKELQNEKCDLLIEEMKVKDALRVRNNESKIVDGLDLISIQFELNKQTHIKSLIQNLKEKLGKKQCELIASQENRVDDECNLFIRLDKKSLNEKKFVLTDSGDCYHIKIKLAAYPKKKETGIIIAKELFEN